MSHEHEHHHDHGHTHEHHDHDHHAPVAEAPNPFTPEEMTKMRQEDSVAGGHVIYLMVGIFLLGIGIYTVVCLYVGNYFQ